MHKAPRLAVILPAVAASLLLASCGRSDDSTSHMIVVGNRDAPFDSGVRLSYAGGLVRAATAEGLVGFDGDGRIVPALADRWIVTDDGASYIFRLRDGTWPDGTTISPEAVRESLRRTLAELRGTPLSLDLSAIGEIRVMAGRVVEIRLTRPMPDFLQLLAQPELGIVRRGQGSGPMRLKRQDGTALLTPMAPRDRGLPDVEDWSGRTRKVSLAAMDAEEAVQRYGKGEADLVLGGGIEDFPRTVGLGLSRGAIQFDPVQGLFGLTISGETGVLENAANREALAMALDRDGLVAAVGLSGWTPSNRIVAAGLPGDLGTIGERWTELSLAERRAEASRRIGRWKSGAKSPARLRVALPGGPGADRLFAALSAQLGTIGVQLVRVAANAPADMRLLDMVARYPSAEWFLNQLSCAARRGLCSIPADRRAAEARMATDAAGRAALLAEAEVELTQANVFIPFGAPIRWSLVRDPAEVGFVPNRWGVHPLMEAAVRPK